MAWGGLSATAVTSTVDGVEGAPNGSVAVSVTSQVPGSRARVQLTSPLSVRSGSRVTALSPRQTSVAPLAVPSCHVTIRSVGGSATSVTSPVKVTSPASTSAWSAG